MNGASRVNKIISRRSTIPEGLSQPGTTAKSIILGLGGLKPSEFQTAVFEMDLEDLLIWIRSSNLHYIQSEIDRESRAELDDLNIIA